MNAMQRIISCTIAGLLWLGALVAKHFWPDVDIGAFTMACGTTIAALGVHGATVGNAATAVFQPGGAQAGFASVRLLSVLASIALGLALLTGCTSMLRGYEATAYQEIKASNDNTVAIWKAAACAMPVGAILRDPETIDAVNRFCGGAKNQLGSAAAPQINVTVQMPASAASAPVK